MDVLCLFDFHHVTEELFHISGEESMLEQQANGTGFDTHTKQKWWQHCQTSTTVDTRDGPNVRLCHSAEAEVCAGSANECWTFVKLIGGPFLRRQHFEICSFGFLECTSGISKLRVRVFAEEVQSMLLLEMGQMW